MEESGERYWSAPTLPEILPAETAEHPDLRKTLQVWAEVRGARAMPAREEITPKHLRHALSRIHLYDVLDGGADFRFRLVGSGVFPGLAGDQTGRLLSEHPDPGIRLRFAAALKHVVETGRPACSRSRRQTGDLLSDARTEGLWLPLAAEGGLAHVLAHSALTVLEPGSAGFGVRPEGSGD